MTQPITSRAHGLLDYPGGIALIAAPWLFGFSDVGGAAVTVPVVLGVLILLQSLITDYHWSIANLVPMPVHLALDAIGGAFLALTPFLFGTTDDGVGAWLPHLVVGLGLIAGAVLTQPHRDPSEHVGVNHRHRASA